MPAWFLFVYFLMFGTSRGLLFNVTRGVQDLNWQDLFSNLDSSAKCPNKQSSPDAGKTWCQERKGECSSQGCCICKCEYPSATFQMNAKTCVGNSVIRSFAGCTKLFESEDQGHPLSTLDFSVPGSKGIPYLPNKSYTCTVKSVEYLSNATWKRLPKKEKDTFSFRGISGWVRNALKWTGTMTSTYFGYIMRVNGECKKKSDVKRGCVVFKAKGTLSWNIPDPTTQALPVTTMLSTTTKAPTTAMSTRKVTTTMKPTTEVKTTTQVLATTQVKATTQVTLTTRRTSTTASLSSTLGSPSTVTKTTSFAKVPSSKQTTQATNRPSPISQETSSSTSHVITESSTESAAATTEVLPTESTVGDVTTIEPTYRNLGSKEPNKDRKKSSGKKGEEDSMMVAIVAGVAAVICVALILLCMWLIISQRRKHRNGGNHGAETTVIANPTTTNSQNHFPMPGLLKNPVYDDSVYAEPEEKVHKSAVGLLGNPSYETYDDLLLTNPGAKDNQNIPLNNVKKKPLNTAKRIPHAKENTHDCADVRFNQRGKPDEEKSVYQSLVKEEARARYRPEVNATYQSLNPDGLMYQPLLKNMAHKHQDEIPEYLVLLNLSESRQISPNPPEYQPPYSTGPPPADVDESPEYADYADLDELEEISVKEASNRTSDQGPSYSAPQYNVPEGPGYDYASAPMYDVLEGPDPYSVSNTNLGF